MELHSRSTYCTFQRFYVFRSPFPLLDRFGHGLVPPHPITTHNCKMSIERNRVRPTHTSFVYSPLASKPSQHPPYPVLPQFWSRSLPASANPQLKHSAARLLQQAKVDMYLAHFRCKFLLFIHQLFMFHSIHGNASLHSTRTNLSSASHSLTPASPKFSFIDQLSFSLSKGSTFNKNKVYQIGCMGNSFVYQF